jgi:hypothetical protein
MSMKWEKEAGNARDTPPSRKRIGKKNLDKLADGGFVHHEICRPRVKI